MHQIFDSLVRLKCVEGTFTMMTTGTTLHALTALFKGRTAFGDKDLQNLVRLDRLPSELHDRAIYGWRLPGYRCRNSVADRR
jgi:hypothetical protein